MLATRAILIFCNNISNEKCLYTIPFLYTLYSYLSNALAYPYTIISVTSLQ